MLTVEETERLKATMEFMEKEYGITPENIDKILEEVKKEYFKKTNKQNIKEAI